MNIRTDCTIERRWAMPSPETFSVPCIRGWVDLWIKRAGSVVVDPFARDCQLGTWTNDLNSKTKARWHMDAEDFARFLEKENVVADCLLFDPPYSPTQMKRVYDSIGLALSIERAQGWGKVRSAFDHIVRPGGIVLSFGWNSNGMGRKRGYTIEDILLVAHGKEHNDTICVAERKTTQGTFDWEGVHND